MIFETDRKKRSTFGGKSLKRIRGYDAGDEEGGSRHSFAR